MFKNKGNRQCRVLSAEAEAYGWRHKDGKEGRVKKTE